MDQYTIEKSFLKSALTDDGEFYSEEMFLEWFIKRSRNNVFSVKQIPFSECENWFFDGLSGNLGHQSGKFFTVQGLSVETTFPEPLSWEQPVIDQPEIGILGIITKNFNGIYYFLMQVKMEPGNVNLNQLSPTVQATKSNYTKVHKGKTPHYLEYFTESSRGTIWVDQLQSEQGLRFLNKRNRNVIVEVVEDIDVYEDFCWLTLGQIKNLFRHENLVNMDARTVLSGIQYADINAYDNIGGLRKKSSIKLFDRVLEGFSKNLYISLIDKDHCINSFEDLIRWFSKIKSTCEVKVKSIPLNKVTGWRKNDFEIKHESGHFFSVIAADVDAGNREVTSWTQPLLKHFSQGIIGFLVSEINGVLHFLVQARMEPGYIDIVEMGPTVSCSEVDYKIKSEIKTPFLEYFIYADEKDIRFSSILSEEGGRFYHFLNRYMVVEVGSHSSLNIPDHYTWMTLGQMMDFIKHTNYLNIEARSLISCLNLL